MSAEIRLRWRRQLRFALGTTIAMGLSALLNFPMAYILPVMVINVLAAPAPCPTPAKGALMMLVFAATGLVGLALSTLVNYPMLCLLITFWLLWQNFLFSAQGGSPLVSLMLAICITAIPVAAMEHSAMALLLTKGLVLVGIFTPLLVWISFAILPDPQTPQKNTAGQPRALQHGGVNPLIFASIRTLLAAPALLLFFYAGLTGQLLTLIFICILLQSPDLQQSVQGGRALLTANLFGGVIAIAFFNLLVAVPEWWAMVLLTLLCSLALSPNILSGKPNAAGYATALSTVLLLIGSSTGTFGGEAEADFYARLLGIGAAVLYLAVAVIFSRWVLVCIGKLPATAS